ncbi:SusC/RagA family TonB-linked outer membrane protein [Sunxiuqinia elliptica]
MKKIPCSSGGGMPALKKLRLIMRLNLFLLLISVFPVAAGVNAQNAKLNLKMTKATIAEVFDAIEQKSDVYFFYNKQEIDDTQLVDVAFENKTIEEVLDYFEKNLSISSQFVGKNVIIKSQTSEFSVQQKRRITGKVTDASGQPLPGVTVLIKGTTDGTITDFDGDYAIAGVSAEGILVFSFVGMKSTEVEVGDKSTINVTMVEDAIGLEEVVAVGYGTQKRASVTGAVSTIKSEEITSIPTSNINSTLAGRTPGVIVRQASGRPGDDVAAISIRGFGVNNTDDNRVQNESPLIIVDGIQRPFSQIDPNEIESITVLKDAAAAVYGIQAAAGVILVTTKRGVQGKPVVSLSSTLSMTQNTQFPKYANFLGQYNALKYADPGKQEQILSNLQGRITPERYAGLQDGSIPGTDWFDVITRDFTPMQQHNLNIRGGTEKVKYFGSIGYLNQGAIWSSKDFAYERFNATMNMDIKVTDRLKLSMDFSWTKEFNDRFSSDGESDLGQLAISEPGFPASLPNGAIPVSNATIGNFNPIAITTKSISGYKLNTVNIIVGSLDLSYDIPGVKGLQVFDKIAVNNTFDFQKELRIPFTPYYYDGISYTAVEPTQSTYLAHTDVTFERLTNQLGLRYNGSYKKHNYSGLLLLETLQDKGTNLFASRNNLISGSVPYLFAGSAASQLNDGSASEFARVGYVGRVNYNYDGKYLLELSGRYDGSPYFPKETRYGFFPGVSVGWVISREPFYNEDGFVNRLKLKTSFAQLGNDNANSFDYLTGYRIVTGNDAYVFDGQLTTGLGILGIANPLITWQRSNTYNLGLEAGLLDNKLSLELDVFYRKRFDLLTRDDISLPSTTGAEVPLSNLESRDNRGVEFLISYRESFNKVKLNTSFNFSWAREKYLDYVESETFENEDQERIQRRSNQWVNRTFGYVFDGFFSSQEEIDNATIDYGGGAGNGNLRPGDIKLKDLNGDKVINSNDQRVIGRGIAPEIMYGWNTSLKWKHFELNMFWQGAANFGMNMAGLARNVDERVPFRYITENVWTPERGNDAIFPARSSGVTNYNYIDKYFVNASFVRLKNLSLAYSLPSSVTEKVGIGSCRFTLSGTNLITIDNLGVYPYDPESGGPTSYPAQRIFTLGLNLTL